MGPVTEAEVATGEIEESEAVLVRLLLGPNDGRASFEEVFTDLLKKAFGADRDLGGAMVESMWHVRLTGAISPLFYRCCPWTRRIPSSR